MNREKVGPTDTPPYHSSIYHIHTLIVSNHFEPKALSNATFPILNFPLEDAEMMEPFFEHPYLRLAMIDQSIVCQASKQTFKS